MGKAKAKAKFSANQAAQPIFRLWGEIIRSLSREQAMELLAEIAVQAEMEHHALMDEGND